MNHLRREADNKENLVKCYLSCICKVASFGKLTHGDNNSKCISLNLSVDNISPIDLDPEAAMPIASKYIIRYFRGTQNRKQNSKFS